MHDIFEVGLPPHARIIPITDPRDRVGTPYIPCPKEKIAAIVLTDLHDQPQQFKPFSDSTAKIGDTVNYKVTIEVAKGASDYELTDTMSDGLSFSSGSIKVDGVALNDTIATLTLKQKEGDPTFTLTFADS